MLPTDVSYKSKSRYFYVGEESACNKQINKTTTNMFSFSSLTRDAAALGHTVVYFYKYCSLDTGIPI